MIHTLNINNNNLEKVSLITNTLEHNNDHWFESKSIAGKYELSQQYASICQQHKQQKKWVLFINPDEASLEELANNHGVDISKILCVNLKNKYNSSNKEVMDLNIEQIKSVLCRGNCSAIILSNAVFKEEEIVELNNCAKQGETQCLVLKTVLNTIKQKHSAKFH